MPRKTKIHASEINYFVLIAVTIGYCLLFSALWKFLVENNLIWLVPVLVIGGFVVRWYLKKKAEKKRMVDLPGETIGKYRVIERLGRGGKAEVYKVYNLQLDKYMAIKILHPHLVEGKDFQERFKREARAVCNLLHPNIIQVFNFDIKGEIPYMIMDFVEGETLKNRMGELNNKNQ